MICEPVIKVGFCVAYDWHLLRNSIPPIYDRADRICLALDKDRHSWSCNPYDFDDKAFFSFVKSIDISHKIDVYEDDFSIPSLSARDNCNRHRKLISERLGLGGWHVQIDSDEYFLDFNNFADILLKINSHPTGREKPVNVLANSITLFKKLDSGYLYVSCEKGKIEAVPIATNLPHYERARHNGHFNIHTNAFFLHESWARDAEQLNFKISNWGHAAEELKMVAYRYSYLRLWNALDENNFFFVKDFHPASPKTWPRLDFVPGKTIEELRGHFKRLAFSRSVLGIFFRNSRLLMKIVQMFEVLHKYLLKKN